MKVKKLYEFDIETSNQLEELVHYFRQTDKEVFNFLGFNRTIGRSTIIALLIEQAHKKFIK